MQLLFILLGFPRVSSPGPVHLMLMMLVAMGFRHKGRGAADAHDARNPGGAVSWGCTPRFAAADAIDAPCPGVGEAR